MRKLSSFQLLLAVLLVIAVVSCKAFLVDNKFTMTKYSKKDRPVVRKVETSAESLQTPLQMSQQQHQGAPYDDDDNQENISAGRLEELKQKEADLARQLAAIRVEKLSVLRSKPLTIGIIGFGRFGQFIAKTFTKYGRVVVTSRSNYSNIANQMGATYVPMHDLDSFINHDLDVVVVAVSILSFEDTISGLVPALQRYVDKNVKGPLIVDVLSVKEHPREIMLKHLPETCDIVCTHPMFGPDSGKDGWHDLNFVYEKTRVDKVIVDHDVVDEDKPATIHGLESFVDASGKIHSVHENSEAHVESMDRIERFLSIWEEEGCRMVPLSCKDHDSYAANSQFITHLMGRILGSQGLRKTPIDTRGFESVLKLVDTTTADSFDLFYGLYKFNQRNSMDTILRLQNAMTKVVGQLSDLDAQEIFVRQLEEKDHMERPTR